MDHWNELRTALMLARHGTVSAAAKALGVHRATVNRHIDLLEQSFGTPLFQRHARGYTLTETGQQLLEVTDRADDMFRDLIGRSQARAGRLSGRLIVTALSRFAPMLMPAIAEFQRRQPDIALEFIAGTQLSRLELGEAHVAFRAGPRPETLDYVVQLYGHFPFGLYVSKAYVARHGMPDPQALSAHRFVGSINPSSPLPYASWMAETVSQAQLALCTQSQTVQHAAVLEGLGLGFLPEFEARGDDRLLPVMPARADWGAPIWIVTHVDLHRTEKVQEFLKTVRHMPALQAG